MGPLLRRQGAQVGLDRAEVWVALGDGGAGLEDLWRTNFPRVAAVILDFFHATEYLAKLSRAVHPTDAAAALAQTKAWAGVLRDEGGHAMIAVLEAFAWPAVRGLAAVRDEVLGYFRNQVHRMDYPTYEANGWYIGCGRERLQDGGRQPDERGRDALE